MQYLANIINNIDSITIMKYANTIFTIFFLYQIFNISYKISNYLFYDNKKQENNIQNNTDEILETESEENNDCECECDFVEDIDENNKNSIKENLSIINRYNKDLQRNISLIIKNHPELFVDKRSNFRLKYNINKHINEYFQTVKFLIKADSNDILKAYHKESILEATC